VLPVSPGWFCRTSLAGDEKDSFMVKPPLRVSLKTPNNKLD
jgi:hypothetical protein